MSKVYKCDACEVMIDNPYKARMKEFYIGTQYDVIWGMLPINCKDTTKVHLCEECYKGLKKIGQNIKNNEYINSRNISVIFSRSDTE